MLRKIWFKILHLGVNDDLPFDSVRKIIAINRILFIICSTSAINLIGDCLKELYFYAIVDVAIIVSFSFFFWLSYKGYYKLSFHCIVLSLNFFLFILASSTGTQSGIFLLFFPLIIISFFFIGINQRVSLFFYSFLPIALLTITVTTDYSLLKRQSISIDAMNYLFFESILSIIIFTGYSLYTIVETNETIEIKLRENKANLNAIYNNGLLNIVFIDKEMRVKNFNELAKENSLSILHLPINKGDYFLDFILKEDKKYFIRSVKKALNGKVTYLEKNVVKDEHDLWYELHFCPVLDETRNVEGIIIAATNITERKRIEIKILEARKNAEADNRSKSQFLSSISQEIRNPMNTLIGIVGELLGNKPREDQFTRLSNLKTSAEKFLIIINDILDFNRLDTGEFELDESEFNLIHLLTTLTNFISPLITNKDLEFVTIYDEKIPTVLIGDSVRLSQIITNLIGNSIRYTERGKIVFEVKLEEENIEYSQIGFYISDTGYGIEEHTIDSIFESYDSDYSDLNGIVPSSGLGLVITKRLLEYMNTTIFLESELRKGAKYYFTLKFKNTERSELDSLNYIIEKREKSPYKKLKNMRLLLVEDYLINQMIVEEFLSKWEVKLDIADNGLQALGLLESKDYDIILMDLQMPELDGFETTKRIRSKADLKYKNIPILALTASSINDIRASIIEAGMNDYISKPFESEELYEKILKYTEYNNDYLF